MNNYIGITISLYRLYNDSQCHSLISIVHLKTSQLCEFFVRTKKYIIFWYFISFIKELTTNKLS